MIVALLAGVIGAGLGVGSAQAYGHINNGLATFPTTVYAYSGLAPESKTAISNACQQWNGAGQGTLVLKSSSDSSTTTYSLENGKNEITRGSRGSNTYLMQTRSYYYSSNLRCYEADVDINMSYAWKNDGSSDAFDVGNAITHELGHLLGLDDSAYTDATMYGSAPLGETKKRTIEQDDKNGIATLYAQ